MTFNAVTKTLLIVAHAPSPNTEKLAQAAYAGANHPDIDINVILKSPQDTQPEDVLAADALLLGTTENLAYMAGLTKDFFDRCYYAVLEEKQGMPCTPDFQSCRSVAHQQPIRLQAAYPAAISKRQIGRAHV